MAIGRERAEWRRFSRLMALLANCHRNAKKQSRPYSENDFNPYPPPPVELTEAQREARAKAMFGLN